MDVDKKDVESGWFFKYLIYHPIFASSTTMCYVTLEISLIFKFFKFLDASMFHKIHEDCLVTPSDQQRVDAYEVHVLNTTLNYRENIKKKPVSYTKPHKVIIQTILNGQKDPVIYNNPVTVIVFVYEEDDEDDISLLIGQENVAGDEDADNKKNKLTRIMNQKGKSCCGL